MQRCLIRLWGPLRTGRRQPRARRHRSHSSFGPPYRAAPAAWPPTTEGPGRSTAGAKAEGRRFGAFDASLQYSSVRRRSQLERALKIPVSGPPWHGKTAEIHGVVGGKKSSSLEYTTAIQLIDFGAGAMPLTFLGQHLLTPTGGKIILRSSDPGETHGSQHVERKSHRP